jgi:CBS domain-containing protein
MKISEIMTPDPKCVSPDASLAEAARVLRDLDVGSVLICDHDRLAGIITDRDICIRAVADGRDPNRTTVRETMSQGVSFVFEDQDVEDAVHRFEQDQIRRLPVLNRDKRLVGIISLGDLAVDADSHWGGEALKEISEPAHPHR